MYAIIEFVDENNAIEMVPMSWVINRETCYWPPKQIKYFEVATFIKKGRGPELSWQQCKIKIIGEASTFEEARKKTKKASFLSDFEGHLSSTDSEMCGRGKRRRQSASQVLISSADEEEDYNPKVKRLPSQPSELSDKFCSTSHSLLKEISNIPSKSSEPRQQCVSSQIISSSDDENECNAKLTKLLQSLPSQRKESPAGPSSGKFCSASASKRLTKEKITNIQSGSSNSSVLQLILKQFSYLRHEVKELRKSVDVLSQRMMIDTDKTFEGPQTKITYPVENMDSLKELEEELKDDNLRRSLINKLKSFGGTNYSDHARRVLRYLFTDSLMMRYTWQGSKDKQQFSKLKVALVVVDAVCEEEKNISRAKVETVIKCWLRHAKERLEYKKK